MIYLDRINGERSDFEDLLSKLAGFINAFFYWLCLFDEHESITDSITYENIVWKLLKTNNREQSILEILLECTNEDESKSLVESIVEIYFHRDERVLRALTNNVGIEAQNEVDKKDQIFKDAIFFSNEQANLTIAFWRDSSSSPQEQHQAGGASYENNPQQSALSQEQPSSQQHAARHKKWALYKEYNGKFKEIVPKDNKCKWKVSFWLPPLFQLKKEQLYYIEGILNEEMVKKILNDPQVFKRFVQKDQITK